MPGGGSNLTKGWPRSSGMPQLIFGGKTPCQPSVAPYVTPVEFNKNFIRNDSSRRHKHRKAA